MAGDDVLPKAWGEGRFVVVVWLVGACGDADADADVGTVVSQSLGRNCGMVGSR